MPDTVPHLHPSDIAVAAAIAHELVERTEFVNRAVISRVGMDIFQGVPSPPSLTVDYIILLYTLTEAYLYVQTFVNDDARCTAFESQIALNVHLISVRRGLPVAAVDALYG